MLFFISPQGINHNTRIIFNVQNQIKEVKNTSMMYKYYTLIYVTIEYHKKTVIKSLIVDIISGARVQTNYLFHFFFKALMFSKTKSLKIYRNIQMKYGFISFASVFTSKDCWFFFQLFLRFENIEKLFIFEYRWFYAYVLMCGLYEASHLKNIFR